MPRSPRHAGTSDRDGRYEQPEVDVPALTALLDGKYAEVRDLVRDATSPSTPSVLDDAETMASDDFRDRVRDLVVEMAGDRPDRAWASPRSTAAAATSARRSRPSRRWRSATCRCWSRSACSSACSAARSSSSAPSAHHDAYLADLVTGRLLGCFAMTETGHGSNVQALGTTRDVRRRDRRSS